MPQNGQCQAVFFDRCPQKSHSENPFRAQRRFGSKLYRHCHAILPPGTGCRRSCLHGPMGANQRNHGSQVPTTTIVNPSILQSQTDEIKRAFVAPIAGAAGVSSPSTEQRTNTKCAKEAGRDAGAINHFHACGVLTTYRADVDVERIECFEDH